MPTYWHVDHAAVAARLEQLAQVLDAAPELPLDLVTWLAGRAYWEAMGQQLAAQLTPATPPPPGVTAREVVVMGEQTDSNGRPLVH